MASKGKANSDKDEESALDRLYQATPEEFVSLRNSLAKELQGQGKTELAAKLRELAKPTVSVWAINQVARQAKDDVQRLLESGDRVRAAQSEAWRGGARGADDLRDADKEERNVLGELVQTASSVLVKAGRHPSPSILHGIETTLHSLAVGSGPERDLLLKGRLRQQSTQVGFPDVADVQAPAQSHPKLSKSVVSPARQSEALARQRELVQAKADATEAKRLAAVEAQRAQEAAARAADLERRAQQAEQAAATLRKEAGAADEEAADARVRAAEADVRSREAELKVKRLMS